MGLIKRIKIKCAIKRIIKENKELLEQIGSDYDENGHPYWDYDWHEDDEHGSNWRLIK